MTNVGKYTVYTYKEFFTIKFRRKYTEKIGLFLKRREVLQKKKNPKHRTGSSNYNDMSYYIMRHYKDHVQPQTFPTYVYVSFFKFEKYVGIKVRGTDVTPPPPQSP